MTVVHYKGGYHPGNDLGLHYTALPPIVASCPYSDQLLVTRKFWSPGANRPSQVRWLELHRTENTREKREREPIRAPRQRSRLCSPCKKSVLWRRRRHWIMATTLARAARKIPQRLIRRRRLRHGKARRLPICQAERG